MKFQPKWMITTILSIAITLSPQAQAQAKKKPVKKPVSYVNQDDAFLTMREAFRHGDSAKVAEIANYLSKYDIPSYVDYYRLKPRVGVAPPTEIQDFFKRYEGSAIADRLRNDWLLELGRKRDWANFDEQYPQFVVNDDTQVKCYALMSRAIKGQIVAEEARALLLAPKEYGEGCPALIATLVEAEQFKRNDLWEQLRLAAETNSAATVRRIAPLADVTEAQLARAIDYPTLTVAKGIGAGQTSREIYLIALGRVAKAGQTGHLQAAHALTASAAKLSAQEQAIGWAQIALPASQNLALEAMEYWRKSKSAPLSTEAMQWKVRAALRAADWKMVKTSIDAMPLALRNDPAWIYWLGRAWLAEGGKAEAQLLFHSIAEQTNFYGQLAMEELGQKITIPSSGAALTAAEIAPMAQNQGLRRALRFLTMDLRFEGSREWNWELRKMSERQLLAAAEFARQKNALDRMVNTSDRTRVEVDFNQRFPAPHNDIMHPTAQLIGLDKAWAYGLIRQESRFIQDAKSYVGASGLMQLMPATARYVAKKIGLGTFSQNQVNDINVNILLGTNYLSMMLKSLDGSQTLATAAYNAGPGRPIAWRATLPREVEGAVFAESIPFTETRVYVKNVLSNATYYAALFENRPQSLKARLGRVAPKGAAREND